MTDASAVPLINRALNELGQEPVTDLSDASQAQSNALVKILRVVELARDDILARHGWTCALEYAALAPAIIPNYVNFRYPVVYQLPADALRVWEIDGVVAAGPDFQCWLPRWQIGTTEVNGSPQLIIRAAAQVDTSYSGFGMGPPGYGSGFTGTNGGLPGGPLNVAYVRRAGWGALDTQVGLAVAMRMAAMACYSITGDAILRDKLAKEAETRIMLAVTAESGQEGGQPAPAPSIPQLLRDYSR